MVPTSHGLQHNAPSFRTRWAGPRTTAALVLVLGLGGCSALSPAMVALLDPEGESGLATLDNSPGHVVITFVNNAEVDERLLGFLESSEGGNLILTEAERRLLRPRMRLRVRVTFVDGTSQAIEFIDGSSTLVDQSFDVQALPDLNQNDLNNAVVMCNVASVELEPGSEIEVFIPVELIGFELLETTNAAGTVIGVTPVERERFSPEFRTIQVDETDPDGNVTLQRNVGLRDVPSPTVNPLCGSVIAIVVDGVLSVPFLFDEPSYDRDDAPTVARIGGRYEFLVTVQ